MAANHLIAGMSGLSAGTPAHPQRRGMKSKGSVKSKVCLCERGCECAQGCVSKRE